ncbi:MAG TPA: 3-hydroxyacyl-CoA dehydrogenase NAD-binding domain-containing protein [Solirubrobacteraceae bacterium]
MSAARVIGVLGAGTMGAGIAQLAARSGARTILHDPIPEALARGVEKLKDGFHKDAARERLSTEEAQAGIERLEPVGELGAFAPCELVIEAAPERIDLKHELYRRLSEIVSEECVLASNTSSLLVTAIAAAASKPERVVGMHFFNPAPVMRLLEVVAGEQSSEQALALAHATGEAMGKTVIRAKDGPGFLVNRCNRPFGLEALRLLQERIADVETIDRICRVEGGFRMGPFELMDLVGVDTGFEISKSFYEQSFGEPRWRPSPITARYVAAGRYGRKTGRGYYDYSRDPYRPADPDPPSAEEEVQPAAGGVLSRIVCQVINECAFALGEGVGSAADIDTGMVLGLNYPRGPLAWADQIGLDNVLAVLDGLWEEYHEERYRSAPELKRLVRAGELGRSTGAGFFSYQEA